MARPLGPWLPLFARHYSRPTALSHSFRPYRRKSDTCRSCARNTSDTRRDRESCREKLCRRREQLHLISTLDPTCPFADKCATACERDARIEERGALIDAPIVMRARDGVSLLRRG